ncbi:MAG TPA: hypothetical protein VG322_02360, partial [Candidatus Acidoferrales bacterium]|nr:hypothetical protein [Candidatus Acidoferrales bacterium]
MTQGNTKVAGRAAWIPLCCGAVALLLSSAVQTRAQEKPYVPWVAPPEARAVKSPLKATPDAIKAGQET